MTKQVDIFGLPPIRKGYVRGRIQNLRMSSETSPYGQLTIIDFDLYVGDRIPTVPVQMRGTDFLNRMLEGWIVDIPDPTPDIRPMTPRRIVMSWNPDVEVISYYPGLDKPDSGRGRAWLTAAMVAGFVLVTAAVIGFALYLDAP